MKRFGIALLGGTLLLAGVVLLVLPGPGALLIAAGLAILASEFLWARLALRHARGAVAQARRRTGPRSWLRRCARLFQRRARKSPLHGNP